MRKFHDGIRLNIICCKCPKVICEQYPIVCETLVGWRDSGSFTDDRLKVCDGQREVEGYGESAVGRDLDDNNAN